MKRKPYLEWCKEHLSHKNLCPEEYQPCEVVPLYSEAAISEARDEALTEAEAVVSGQYQPTAGMIIVGDACDAIRAVKGEAMGVNMVRPEWYKFVGSTSGAYLACSCGSILQCQQATREHWQMGHFDYVEEDKPKERKP